MSPEGIAMRLIARILTESQRVRIARQLRKWAYILAPTSKPGRKPKPEDTRQLVLAEGVEHENG